MGSGRIRNYAAAPRLFLRPDCSRVGISADWQSHVLPAATAAERIAVLRARSPEADRKFAAWNGSDDMDFVFYRSGPMAPVFEDALASTRCAFAAWKELARQDGFRLTVAADSNVDDPAAPAELQRLRSILADVGLPLLNLRDDFSKHGDLRLTRWKFDSHWTPTGHRWAADALLQHVEREIGPRQ